MGARGRDAGDGAPPLDPGGGLTLYLDTLRALLWPRRLLPLVLVVAAMLYAQAGMAMEGLQGHLPAVAMAATFVLVAPFAWRALPKTALGLAVLVALSGLPVLVGYATQRALDLGPVFVTLPFHLPVTAALFLAGGWGLGRDIDLEQRAERLAREAERAQLLAIRAHLDPHFLFNTLNAIAEWTREDPETAEGAILRLSDLLREVLGGLKAEAWPLERELALARDLLELHRMRDPTWFSVRWEVQDVAMRVPPLLLLPLVENAVKHGPAKGHRGEIALAVGPGRIVLRNPGPYAGPRAGGEGLDTVRKRLALAYRRATLELREDGGATVAELRLPPDPDAPA